MGNKRSYFTPSTNLSDDIGNTDLLDNVIVTPHNAGFSDMNRDRSISIMKENVKRYFQNNSLLNEVNKLKGY